MPESQVRRCAHPPTRPSAHSEATFDVLVIGGGMAGICAAIAASRNGCETALIEMDELLGGNASPLLGVHVSGAHSFHPYASETGIIEEIELEAARQAAKTRTWGSHYNISYQWDLVLQQKLEEAGVRVFRRHQGRRAITEGRRVVGVVIEDIQHFQTKLFHVRHGIIDASGDGVVAEDAGAAFMWGTEGRDRFGERSAPEQDSPHTMGTSLTALVLRREQPVEFVMPPEFAARAAADKPMEVKRRDAASTLPAPAAADKLIEVKRRDAASTLPASAATDNPIEVKRRDAASTLPATAAADNPIEVKRRDAASTLPAPAAGDKPHERMKGYPASWNPKAEFCFLWVTESGGERNTITDDAEIRREILFQLYRCWDNVKNFSFVEEARNWELVWVSPKSGKRESRRFVGDYVLTQTDVESARQFEDAIGYGGYGVDIHEPVGKRCKIVFHSIPPLWSFPYRSAYSKDFDNLWLAGRLMSVTHLALGTVRLMRTLACIGQGVGTAVALVKRYGCTAREVYERHHEQLQQTLLRQDATLLGVTNSDPSDLSRQATVSATSEMRHGATRIAGYLPLDVPRGVQLWDWASTLETVEFFVRNTTDREQRLTLRLGLFESERPWKLEQEFAPFKHLRTAGNRMEWGSDNRIARFKTVAETMAVAPVGFEGWLRFAFPTPVTMAPKDPTSDENRYSLLLDACPGVELAT
ncbi:MAG: FAD-dependent oxidoreductase, partial [Planctomycetes bacterium]|nr:FAD-dependent oxidoreductase [Planctomycetota bacterium]